MAHNIDDKVKEELRRDSMQYLGTRKTKKDDKGRITFPVVFQDILKKRKEITEGSLNEVYLMINKYLANAHTYLSVYDSIPEGTELHHVERVSLDKKFRISTPEGFRREDRDLTLLGHGDHIKICYTSDLKYSSNF